MAVDKLTFGPKPGLVSAVRAMGVNNWIDQQLDPSGLPDAEGMLSGSEYDGLRNTNIQNWERQRTDDIHLDRELDHATVLRAVHSERQLYEVMCDFWANHFNTWRSGTWLAPLKMRDNEDVSRAHALGKFSDMLSASVHSPAMLDYLDNLRSNASDPGGVNENYARELLELHTLGIIDGSHVYDESDVVAVAHIISGWGINWDDGPTKYDFRYMPWAHSYEAQSLLGGAFTVPARSYGEGYEDGVALIDFLAHHPSTARFICWKLVQLFVADAPPMSLVDSAAAVFTANDTAIAPTLRHIFMSPEFAASRHGKVRRPFHHFVGCLRALDADIGTDPQLESGKRCRWAMDLLGQPLFERPSPDGYPEEAAHWVSSDGLLKRWQIAADITRNRLTWKEEHVVVDLQSLLPATLPATAAGLVSWIAAEVANFEMPGVDVDALCAAIGVDPTGLPDQFSGDDDDLGMVVSLVLSHPIFQRR